MIRFSNLIRRRSVPYKLVQSNDGQRDADGVYRKGPTQSVQLYGCIQPLGSSLLQTEGGKYTADDRALYTTYAHENGQVVEYAGNQYRVIADDDRSDYCDTHKFKLKRVTTHDPIP